MYNVNQCTVRKKLVEMFTMETAKRKMQVEKVFKLVQDQ